MIIAMKRRGGLYFCPCPYPHKDGEVADLVLKPDKLVYHCFWCGCGGILKNPIDINQLGNLRESGDGDDVILIDVMSDEGMAAERAGYHEAVLRHHEALLCDMLPPDIAPFIECGRLQSVTDSAWVWEFPAKAAVAKSYADMRAGEISSLLSERLERQIVFTSTFAETSKA